MAGTVKEEDVICVREQAVAPYAPEYLDCTEGDFSCKGQEFADFKKRIGSIHIGTAVLGRIPFDFDLEQIRGSEYTEREILLNIHCNNGSPDPYWRCAFSVTVECPQSALEGDTSIFEHSMVATRTVNTLTIPILKRKTCNDFTILQIKANIKVTSWPGFYPEHVQSFTEKTDISDATLIVQGQRLYVSRAILAIHSTYFHTLFYNRGFKDAAKKEFVLADVDYDEMNMFLHLIYPENADEKYKCVDHINYIEDMLTLGERFGCDSIMRLMEKFLMGEMQHNIRFFSYVRRLDMADRFRLSAPLSFLMNGLRDDEMLQRLGDSEEYSSLSKDIRAAILDMRMRRPIEDDFEMSKRAAFIERRQESSRQHCSQQGPVGFAERKRKTDETYASEAAVRRANAVLRPTMPSDEKMWEDFEVAVAGLPAAVANVALTSAQSDDLNRGVRYVQELSESEYKALPLFHRISLNAHLRMLLKSVAAGVEERQLKDSMATLLSLVNILTRGGQPARKRMRMRNYVLRPQ